MDWAKRPTPALDMGVLEAKVAEPAGLAAIKAVLTAPLMPSRNY